MADKKWLQDRRTKLQGDIAQARQSERNAAEFALRAEGALLLIDEQLAEMAKAPEAPTIVPMATAQQRHGQSSVEEAPVACNWCGKAIVGRKFKQGEQVFCDFACADKAAQGRED